MPGHLFYRTTRAAYAARPVTTPSDRVEISRWSALGFLDYIDGASVLWWNCSDRVRTGVLVRVDDKL